MKNRNAHQSKGPPRWNATERLLSRFYEPLVLLHVLDRNGEQKRSRCPSSEGGESELDLQELRRNFLNQLAYVCDHTKGGRFVTAIALERQPSAVTFWVTSNSTISESTLSFLQGILEALRSLAIPQTEQSKSTIEVDLLRSCIEFNRKRIEAYRKLMQKPLQMCLEYLRSSKVSNDKALAEWLAKFQTFEESPGGLCRFSYEQRASSYLKDLREHIGDGRTDLNQVESARQNFLLVRHYIGRLGTHLKAVNILITAGKRMPDLFENFTIKNLPGSKQALSAPPTDRMTTLDGILRRMLPAESEQLSKYQEALEIMDSKFNIQDRLLAQYESKEFRPRVHAELILLEFFHTKQLPFFDDDKFIGCSKPACYCCYHYISLHPGGFVRPPTHGVRHLSWRPPDIIDENDEGAKRLQRDVMNKLIAQIRLDAFRHINLRKGPSPWHPDSTTGITDSQLINGPATQELDVLPDSASRDSKEPSLTDTWHTNKAACAYSTDQDVSNVSAVDDGSDSDGGALL